MKFTKNMYVCARRRQGFEFPREGEDPLFIFELLSFDPTSLPNTQGWVLAGRQTVEVEIADFNPHQAEIEALEKELARQKEESAGVIKRLEDRLAELKCLEYNP